MQTNIVAFPTRLKTVRNVRDREKVLEHLIPKMLGLMWNRGNGPVVVQEGGSNLTVHGGQNAVLGSDLVINAYDIGPGRLSVSVYYGPLISPTKVFSAYLADRAYTDGERWTHYAGRCLLMSWKRGEWEDRIMAESVDTRTIAHVLTAGLVRKQE